MVAFVSDLSGDDDVYLLDLETGTVANLTHAPGEDRDPAFAPDGQSLVFRSNAGGSWALYQIDLTTSKRTLLGDGGSSGTAYKGHYSGSQVSGYRYAYESYQDGNLNIYVDTDKGVAPSLTRNRAGDYGPAWRPNAPQIAFASWREGQKDLYLIDADGNNLVRLTTDPGDEEEPAWHPGGRRLAFARYVDWNADLYELDLASGKVQRLTTDPYPDRSPAYAPDGTLFWARYVPGKPFEVHDPFLAGHWQLWMRSADGKEQAVPLPSAEMDVYTPVAGVVPWVKGLFPPLAVPIPAPTPVLDRRVDLVELDVNCAGGNPRLNPAIVDSYQAWRADILAQTGYDFLGTTSDMFRTIAHAKRNYGHLSWHRAARAVDTLFEWHDPPEARNQLWVVREDLGPQTYWRMYLECRQQDGTMGEPMTVAPWVWWYNLKQAKEPEAYANGGRPDTIPSGYLVDLTRLAKRHGWQRIASYEEADFGWKTDSVGTEFWHYQRTDGLTWWQAMSQIYRQETLEKWYGWTVGLDKLGLDAAWMLAKGIPTPTPTPRP